MRAAVTGTACLCAAGDSPQAVLRAMTAGGVCPNDGRTLSEKLLPFPVFTVPEHFFPGGRRHSAHDTLVLAEAVVRQAVLQAGLDDDALRDAGLVAATTAGCSLHFLDAYAAFRGGADAADLHDRDDYFSGNLALELLPVLGGPRLTVSNACTSGADAVGLGLSLLATGQCPLVVCVGADALSLVPHTGFARLTVASPEACRPFDRDRRGLNLGEGAAALVLEGEASVHARGVSCLGHVAGYGAASDAWHLTAPHPEGRGLARAVQLTMQDAGCRAEDLAFVNAHATATRENDRIEGNVLRRLLPDTPVWACKGSTGHTLGAAGALEAVLSLAALNAACVPPSQGFSAVDPEIGLIPTTEPIRRGEPFALSVSLGFGGGNSALLLQRGDA